MVGVRRENDSKSDSGAPYQKQYSGLAEARVFRDLSSGEELVKCNTTSDNQFVLPTSVKIEESASGTSIHSGKSLCEKFFTECQGKEFSVAGGFSGCTYTDNQLIPGAQSDPEIKKEDIDIEESLMEKVMNDPGTSQISGNTSIENVEDDAVMQVSSMSAITKSEENENEMETFRANNVTDCSDGFGSQDILETTERRYQEQVLNKKTFINLSSGENNPSTIDVEHIRLGMSTNTEVEKGELGDENMTEVRECSPKRKKEFGCLSTTFNSNKNNKSFITTRSSSSGMENHMLRKRDCPSSSKRGKCFHSKSVLGTEECKFGKPFQCSLCQKLFTNKITLVNHLHVHSDEKRFKCFVCQKSFKSRQSLYQHKRVHKTEKPFKCTYCKKAFTFRHNLTIHIRTHTGERPYKCSECNKAFYQQSNMTSHMRIHTKEKPFKCSECNKAFSQLTNLKTHMRIHFKEKPYKCSECNKEFSRFAYLITHKRIHAQ